MERTHKIMFPIIALAVILIALFIYVIVVYEVRVELTSHTTMGGPESPLYYSIGRGDSLDTIRAHIHNNPSEVSEFFFNGKSLLAMAIKFNRADVIPLLVEHGADPSGNDVPGEFAPLIIAVIQKNRDAVALLLQYDVQPDVLSPTMGMSPLALAKQMKLHEIVAMMEQYLEDRNNGTGPNNQNDEADRGRQTGHVQVGEVNANDDEPNEARNDP